jgi:hypothetical protein
MKTKANKRMERLLSRLTSTRGNVELDESLTVILRAGFVVEGDSVLLRSQKKLGKVAQANFPDATGYECFVNHVHIEDHVLGKGTGSITVHKQALEFGRRLSESLSSSFPGKPFLVVLACSESGSSVRFHAVRPGQGWLAEDLEGYAGEAILTIET